MKGNRVETVQSDTGLTATLYSLAFEIVHLGEI